MNSGYRLLLRRLQPVQAIIQEEQPRYPCINH